MEEIIYQRFKKKYRKIGRDEIIQEGAMQSWAGGELQPIKNVDGRTVGSTPTTFSAERDFYNPIKSVDGKTVGGTLLENFNRAIDETKFSTSEITAFAKDPRLALLVGARIGYVLGLNFVKNQLEKQALQSKS